MRKILSFSAACFLLATSTASAAPKTAAKPPTPENASATELIERARKESTSSGVVRDGAPSDAQVPDGILTLEDPGLSRVDRTWTFFVGLRVQNFAPQGEATMTNGQNFDLAQAGATMLPTFELGTSRLIRQMPQGDLLLGLQGEAGYASQGTDVTYQPSGIKASNSRLSTGTVAGSVLLGFRPAQVPSLTVEAGWSEGMVTYSHSSPNQALEFTSNGRFRGPRLGAYYLASTNWAVGLEQAWLNSAKDADVQVPGSSLSLGTRVEW